MHDDMHVDVRISPERLRELLTIKKVAREAAAEELGAAGAAIKKAKEHEGLDEKAFAVIEGLFKLDAKRAAYRWRKILEYATDLGFGDQGDIEDHIRKISQESRSPTEAAADGDLTEANRLRQEQAERLAKRTKEVAEQLKLGTLTKHPRKTAGALKQFGKAVEQAADTNTIDPLLERFSLDYPEAAQDALGIAERRFKEIAEERQRRLDEDFEDAEREAAEA